MIRLELNDVNELMQLYQASMAGKFAEGADDLLINPSLAKALDKLVDQIIAQARSSHNEPMVEMMEQYRQLTTEYPQYQRLQQFIQQQSHEPESPWSVLDNGAKKSLLMTAAKPLCIDDELIEVLLSTSTV